MTDKPDTNRRPNAEDRLIDPEEICRTAQRLQTEVSKCLRFVRDSRALIESGRLPMFADTYRNWCRADEALHTVWVNLHYDSISHGVGRSDHKTAWGALKKPT